MHPREYETLFQLEDSYWWFLGLRRILIQTLQRHGVGSTSRVLDAGCGTGANLAAVRDAVSMDVFGFDVSEHAAAKWSARDLDRGCLASITDIPFADATFDAVISVDVVETAGVDDRRALGEMARITRKGGIVLLVVPAYDWLLNQRHHRAVHADKRYSRRRVRHLLGQAGLQPVYVTHLFPTLLPVIAVYRLLQRISWSGSTETEPRSDLRPLPRRVNEALYRVVAAEARLLRRISFPWGSSLLTVGRR